MFSSLTRYVQYQLLMLIQSGVCFNGMKHHQIDIAPTVSLLLGVPIPSGNLGMFASEALTGLESQHKLMAAYINAKQMLRLIGNYSSSIAQGNCGSLMCMSLFCKNRFCTCVTSKKAMLMLILHNNGIISCCL